MLEHPLDDFVKKFNEPSQVHVTSEKNKYKMVEHNINYSYIKSECKHIVCIQIKQK